MWRGYTKPTPDRPCGGVTLNRHKIDHVEGLHQTSTRETWWGYIKPAPETPGGVTGR